MGFLGSMVGAGGAGAAGAGSAASGAAGSALSSGAGSALASGAANSAMSSPIMNVDSFTQPGTYSTNPVSSPSKKSSFLSQAKNIREYAPGRGPGDPTQSSNIGNFDVGGSPSLESAPPQFQSLMEYLKSVSGR